MLAGSMLGSLAGTVLGGMVAQHFFGTHPEASHLFEGPHDQHADASLADHHASGDTFDNDGDFVGDLGSDTFDV
jgi:hypothetical protein